MGELAAYQPVAQLVGYRESGWQVSHKRIDLAVAQRHLGVAVGVVHLDRDVAAYRRRRGVTVRADLDTQPQPFQLLHSLDAGRGRRPDADDGLGNGGKEVNA